MTMKAFSVAVLGFALAAVLASPASAVYYGAWTIEDGACDGVAFRYEKSARTDPTTYATCYKHRVQARFSSSGIPYWTQWKEGAGSVKWDTTGITLDSHHAVVDW